ncbi:YqaA family protein [Paracoccaceae bacterium GXU_MW_L88]
MIASLSILAGLFLTCLGAATFLPFQSEIVFIPLVLGDRFPLWLLLFVASVGNTIGSFIMYWIGREIEHFKDRRWFPLKPEQLEKAERWFQKYGLWSLFLSWAPFGDALVLISGVLRTPLPLFLLIVGFAKFARYVAVAWLTLSAQGT